MRDVDSRCGLNCGSCDWKESHGCGGCIETMGHPFHGECHIAICCQSKGYTNCGECDVIPCEKLYSYTYLDPEHGDNPQGMRVETCRRWAGEKNINCWENVLLTSAGFEDSDNKQKVNIVNCFLKMLEKPISEVKILFIPTAATTDEAKKMAVLCKEELIRLGAEESNIFVYHIDGSITEDEAMKYDVVYIPGGDTFYLLNRIKETGFDNIIKKMVYANKVYIGVSAGSLIATPNIGEPFNKETAGLCLLNVYLSVHCEKDEATRTDLPLPHIPLTDSQALIVKWNGYRLIE